MRKNVRVRRRKYNSRKKYVFPMIALSILFVASLIGVHAAVGDTFIENGIKYKVTSEKTDDDKNVTGGEVMMIGYDKTEYTDVNPLETLDVPATAMNTTGTSGDVSYNVTAIGSDAFDGCVTLKKVDLSNATNLTSIGNRAFRNCINLTEIDFPDDESSAQSFKTILPYAFHGCTGLTTVDFSSTALSRISKAAFMNCYNLQEVTFPSTVNLISEEAFAGCVWLTKLNGLKDNTNVTIASGDVAAFYGCCYLEVGTDDNPVNLPKSSDKNPDPFGKDYVITDLKSELRGTSIEAIIAADGNTLETVWKNKNYIKNGVYAPIRVYRAKTGTDGDASYKPSYKILFNPESDYKISGLELLGPNEKIPTKYEIDENVFKATVDPDVYMMMIPSNWTKDPTYIFAVATSASVTGAPTITTETLPSGVIGESYVGSAGEEIKLEANSESPVTWSIVEGSLPHGLSLNSATGVISGTPTKQETATFVAHVKNSISSDKKAFTIEINSTKLPAPTGLKWSNTMEEGRIYAVWNVVDFGTNNVEYSVQLYRNGEKVGEPKSITLLDGENFDSLYTHCNFSDEINKFENGLFTFTVTAKSDGYSSSNASEMSPVYEHGYNYYEVTVSPGVNGTISLSQSSALIEGITITNIEGTNDYVVKVREDVVSESNPLVFDIKADAGCEIASVTRNGSPVVTNNGTFSFTELEENQVLAAEFALISNRLTGINADSYHVKGAKLEFEAIGHNMDANGVHGNTRWIPYSWKLVDSDGNTSKVWDSKPYTDTVDTTDLEVGKYTLQATYRQQRFVSGPSGWTDTGETDQRSISFNVVASEADIPKDDGSSGGDDPSNGDGSTDGDQAIKDETSDDDDSAGGTTSSGGSSGGGSGGVVDAVTSYLSNPQTGDNILIGLWGAIALFSLAGIGLCGFRMFKLN